MKSNRSNRITVTSIEGELSATFWRTHRRIAVVTAQDMGYTINPDINQTANKELFRVFAIDKAEESGINYDSSDRRSGLNKFPRYWTDNEMIQEWSYKMIERDMAGWMSKISPDLIIEEITLVGLTDEDRYKNKDSIKSARIEMDAHIIDSSKEDTGTTILITLEIRSGQMTKPQLVVNNKWNYTNFRAILTQDMMIEKSARLEDMTKPQLKQIIADEEIVIKGISKLTKDQLVAVITKSRG